MTKDSNCPTLARPLLPLAGTSGEPKRERSEDSLSSGLSVPGPRTWLGGVGKARPDCIRTKQGFFFFLDIWPQHPLCSFARGMTSPSGVSGCWAISATYKGQQPI